MSLPTVTEQRVCVFRSEIEPQRFQKLGLSTNLLKEDTIRRAGLNYLDAEELEFLLN
jgi:hypothetical protein